MARFDDDIESGVQSPVKYGGNQMAQYEPPSPPAFTPPKPKAPTQPIAPIDFSGIDLGFNFNLDTGYGLDNVITPDVKDKMQNIDYSALADIPTYTPENPPPPPPIDVIGDKARANELLMQSSGALTANPMPSMPSISNVGAAPFSGSINWNAIPGGFQPLPQVTGGKKRLYQLSKFHGGINQKSSARDISDTECQEAKNVTVSQVGRITLLGDIKNTNNDLTTDTLAAGGATHIPSPGYGLYVFKSGYSLEATPTQGDYTVVAATDGRYVRLKDSTTSTGDYLDIAGADTHVAPTFYASGNGLYVCDANLIHTTSRKVAMLVYRKDMNNNEIVTGWQTGEALLTSPDVGTGNDDVTMVDATGTRVEASPGAMTVYINPTGSGNWGSSGGIVYSFYVSYLFDNGCETGLSFMNTDTLTDQTLDFNVSLSHANGAELGGDKRIHGARIYFREAGTVERYLLAEVSLPDGVKGALDSTFTPWDIGADPVYDLANHINFKSPPELYTYVALNGYYANEMYDKSPDDATVAPVPHEVRYRTATVGSNGAVFIGCYMFRGKLFADGMMYSMKNKPGVFPELNVFDSPSSDGTPITALVSFKDKILQFKQDAMYVINISNPSQFYTEASFRNCGVMNPCQTFATPFGVIFANYIGCFIYDGNKVISLTSGKFTVANWGISEGSVVDTVAGSKDAVKVPCVGYDPRSQSIIVLKDIGDDATSSTSPDGTGAWVYHMGTQSWTEGTSLITNTNSDRHSNFIISPNGYLSICQSDEEALKNYNYDKAVDTDAQTITYQTKDLDFGLPSQTKKLFKIYITYKGTPPSTINYRIDGSSTVYGLTATNWAAAALDDYEVATFVPDDTDEGKDWKSISIYMNGSAGGSGETFEINDISILYRPRPIK
jgi:hypothetical protein